MKDPVEQPHKITKLFKEWLPKEEDRIVLILTIMGCSVFLVEFLLKHRDFIHLPPDITYYMANIMGNFRAFQKMEESPIDVRLMYPDFENWPSEEKMYLIVNELYALMPKYKRKL